MRNRSRNFWGTNFSEFERNVFTRHLAENVGLRRIAVPVAINRQTAATYKILEYLQLSCCLVFITTHCGKLLSLPVRAATSWFTWSAWVKWKRA